jgi:hypothetical protein
MRTAFHSVAAPEIPLHLLGYGNPNAPRLHAPQTVHASQVPLYLRGLGVVPGQIVAASAPAAGAITSGLISSSAAAGSAWGAAAGPIGAAVGVVVGLIGGLLAGHEIRAKQARNENQAVNIGVAGFDSDLKQIWQAYKSGQIDSAGALQAVEQTLMPGYYTVVVPQIQPGRNGCQGGAYCPPDTSPARQPCQGNIGAACCVGCYQLQYSVSGPNGVIAAIQGTSGSSGGPHVADIHIVAPSKYGVQMRAAYTLDFTPPSLASLPAGASSSGDALSAISSAFTTAGSGSSLLPWLALGALAVYALS